MEYKTFETNYKDKLTFWPHLSKGQQIELSHHSHETHFTKGQNIHGNLGECTGVLCVRHGSLRAYMLSDKGREITLYRLEPGDICTLSASCVLDAITFDVFIDADTDSDVLIISSMVFASLTRENLYVENFALTKVTERFSDVMWAMQQILFMSFDRRLAIFLLDEYHKRGDVKIHLTMEEIARYMGSAREVVSRMIKYFATEGIVAHGRGYVTLLNLSKLHQLAQDDC